VLLEDGIFVPKRATILIFICI